MTSILIQNCHLLRRADPVLIETHRDILIEGAKISGIFPTDKIDPAKVDEVISGREMLCLPGLINTHAHIPMVLFRGLAEDVPIERWFNDFIWPLESNLTAEDVYWGAQLALVEMIECGVTTVADHYFYMDRVAEAVQQAGTRAVLGSAVFSSLGLEGLQASADFVERWQNQADGRITTLMAPHAPYTCDDEYLRAAVEHAKRLNVGIHIHAAERVSQTTSSLESRGETPIQVLAKTGVLDVPTIIAHGAGILPEDIELLKQAGHVGVAHAPKTYLKLANELTPIAALREAGIPVGLATDGAASNSTLDILEAMRLMAMLQKFTSGDPEQMPIPTVLDLTFRGSAAVLGMRHSIGAVEEGYLADLILVDFGGAHHQPLHSITASLIYNARAGDVQTVICNGQIIMQDREHKTLDKEKIIAQVRQNMDRLATRIPEKRIQVYNP